MIYWLFLAVLLCVTIAMSVEAYWWRRRALTAENALVESVERKLGGGQPTPVDDFQRGPYVRCPACDHEHRNEDKRPKCCLGDHGCSMDAPHFHWKCKLCHFDWIEKGKNFDLVRFQNQNGQRK